MPPENGEINRETINELAQWIAEAQERHPEIVAARLQWEVAKAKVESVRSEGLPTVDLTGNFYQNGYPNQALQARKTNVSTLGVTLNIPYLKASPGITKSMARKPWQSKKRRRARTWSIRYSLNWSRRMPRPALP